MAQYIGKTISLISVTDNRYVGLLECIDSENGVVTLNKVRCFGTEGRKQWGPQEIYPNPTVYDTVTFNGNDVKDLNILDVKLEDVQPVLPRPQVVMPQQQQQQQQQPQQQQVPAAMAGYGVYAPSPATASATEQPKVSTKEGKEEPKHESRKEVKKEVKKEQRETPQNDHSLENKYEPRQDARRGPRKVEIPVEDFDFQSNNAKFDRPEENDEHELAGKDKDDVDGAFYNRQSSFFDTISTSTETNTNMRWQEERQLNMDTFGQASVANRRGRGGFRGGRGQNRGRGGRGGRGRGGFRRNDNNYDSRENSSSEKIEF